MHAGAEPLLDCADRTFNFSDMAVSCDNVHFDWAKILTDAFELIVRVDVADVGAAGTLKGNGGPYFLQDGLVGTVGNWGDCVETDATGDGMEESNSLCKEKIKAQRDVLMKRRDRCREGNGFERGGSGCGSGPGRLSVEGSHVRAVNV